MKFVWLSLPLFLALSCWAHAAESENELGELSLEELSKSKVVTASKTEQDLGSAPATIYVFSDKAIAQHGYRNLAQLLNDIPEVEVNVRGSIEPYNLVTIRGMNDSELSLVILQDGVKITSIVGSPTAMQFNFPLDYAKRVEVLIGPSSAIYGADAFSGIVNIITKNAEDLKGGTVTGSYGRFGTTDNSVVYGNTFGDLKVVVHASQYYSSDPFFPQFYPNQYAGYYNYQNNGTVNNSSGGTTTAQILPYNAPTKAYTFGGKINLGSFEFGYSKSSSTASSSIGTMPQDSLYIDSAQMIEEIQTIYGRYTYRTDDNRLKSVTQLYQGSQTMAPESRYVNEFDNYSGGYKYEVGKCFEVDEDIYYTFSDQYKLTAGVVYQDFSVLPKTADLPTPYDENVGSSAQSQYFPGTSIPIPFYSIFYQNYGAFGQLQIELSDSVELTLGARYDYNTRFQGSANPRIVATYSPDDKPIKGRFFYGEAYHAPEPYTEYSIYGSFNVTNGTPTGGYFNLPNPDIKPAKLRSVEGDLTYFFTQDLSISTDLFVDWITGYTGDEDLPSGTVFQGVPVTGVHRVYNGLLRSYGGTVRIDATANWKSLFIVPTLAYSLIDGDLNQGQLPNTAKNAVKAGVRFTQGKLTVMPRFEFRGKSYAGDQVSYAPAYDVFQLSARYENILATDRYPLAVFMNITNVLDRRYANSSDLTGANFAAVPQDPIRFEGGATLVF
jgi:outer membrane receptor protein involved in Fe transport